MTAPSTFNLTGTFTEPDASVSAGTVLIQSTDARFKNNSNILNQVVRGPIVLDGSGTIGTQVLPQATNGYDVTIKLQGHADRKQHIAGTANLSITPSHTTMVVSGTWYSSLTASTLATGTIEITDVDNGDLYIVPLVSGAIAKTLFKNTGGFVIVEKIDGRTANGQSSYVIPGNASLDLTTV